MKLEPLVCSQFQTSKHKINCPKIGFVSHFFERSGKAVPLWEGKVGLWFSSWAPRFGPRVPRAGPWVPRFGPWVPGLGPCVPRFCMYLFSLVWSPRSYLSISSSDSVTSSRSPEETARVGVTAATGVWQLPTAEAELLFCCLEVMATW